MGITFKLIVCLFLKLAFRSVQHSLVDIKRCLNQLLQIPDSTELLDIDPSIKELYSSVNCYLRSTADKFDVNKNVEVFPR